MLIRQLHPLHYLVFWYIYLVKPDSFTLSTISSPSSGIFYLVSFSGVCCPLLSGHTRLFWHPPASLTTIWYSGTFIWSPSSGISCPLLSGHTMIISYGTPSFPLHYLVSYPVSLLSDRTRFFWHPPASLSLSLFWSLLSSLIWSRLLSGRTRFFWCPPVGTSPPTRLGFVDLDCNNSPSHQFLPQCDKNMTRNHIKCQVVW